MSTNPGKVKLSFLCPKEVSSKPQRVSHLNTSHFPYSRIPLFPALLL